MTPFISLMSPAKSTAMSPKYFAMTKALRRQKQEK
jgi:hypothetical protein